MTQKEKFTWFVILVIIIFVILKSIIEFTFWQYPKNCIFFELDFSKQCVSDTWNYTINWNIEDVWKSIEKWVNNYIEHKTDKIERKLENIKNNLNNIEVKTNISSWSLDLEVINN